MVEDQATNVDITHPSFLKVLDQKKRVKDALKDIKHKIGIYSAKGGVGKTSVAVNLAFALKEMGYKVGILDADVDCPNLTLFLGVDSKKDEGYPLQPLEVKGAKIISTAMYLDDVKRPIIWRGPVIAKMIGEFLENTEWGKLDYLIIDLPPGTSDAPLSIMQLLDLDGFILVTTPQYIASINAIRSGNMAKRLGIAILGVVENMSEGEPKGGKEVASALGCDVLGVIRRNEKFNEMSDKGIVPVLEDESIKKTFIDIASKLPH
jgi:ATP-binding protein involved in chromosome partitioning